MWVCPWVNTGLGCLCVRNDSVVNTLYLCPSEPSNVNTQFQCPCIRIEFLCPCIRIPYKLVRVSEILVKPPHCAALPERSEARLLRVILSGRIYSRAPEDSRCDKSVDRRSCQSAFLESRYVHFIWPKNIFFPFKIIVQYIFWSLEGQTWTT